MFERQRVYSGILVDSDWSEGTRKGKTIGVMFCILLDDPKSMAQPSEIVGRVTRITSTNDCYHQVIKVDHVPQHSNQKPTIKFAGFVPQTTYFLYIFNWPQKVSKNGF